MNSGADTLDVAKSTGWRGRWDRFLRRPWLVAATLVMASLVTSILVSLAHWPQPATHDEFSYLLAADTFCSGRVANPTHPLWQHFESFHIIQQPTYASKYPPGQGGALAAGRLLAGHPLVGVWLESALAAAAIYWMLLGWTTPRWALVGGVLWLAHPKFQLAWGQSYWGGTLAFLGGALVFGAALRIRRRTATLDAVAMAVGALVLATTRPFEGFVFCLMIGAWLTWGWVRDGLPPRGEFVRRMVLPQAIILGLGIAGLAAYNAAVTGDPLTMPYLVHEQAYAQCPMFLGQEPAHPTYRHVEIEKFHGGWALDWFRWQSSLRGLLHTKVAMTWLSLEFFFPPALAIGFMMVRPWRWGRVRPALAVAAVTFLISLASIWNFPHYMAPFAPLLMLAAIAGLRRADVLGRRYRWWLRPGSALVAVQVGVFVGAAFLQASKPYAGWWDVRAAIAKQLNEAPGRDLVLVRYGENHSTLEEWVYNDADVDGSPIVWARSMGPENDAELLRYFGDRQVWLLEPESRQLRRMSSNSESLAKHSHER